jgi:hypothetical protein
MMYHDVMAEQEGGNASDAMKNVADHFMNR